MKKIVNWLMSCGYNEQEARKEAAKMIQHVRWDGCEMCSVECAIESICADIDDMYN